MARLGMRPQTPAMMMGETDDEEIPPPRHLEIPVEELGLTAHIADAELLREKMILGGIVIDSVTGESAPRGLQAGDVVLTCTTVWHLEGWTWLGAGFPGIEEARAVTLTLRHITTNARQSVDVELAASAAPWWKPYPFLVLRDGQVLDLRFSSEREERGK